MRGQGLPYAALGALFGAAGALAAGRILSAMLYETSATDILSFVAAAAVLALAAHGASLVAACRAAKVDPIVALRAD